MPTYAYVCTECDHSFEAVQAITDDALTECPSCGGTLRKKFHPVGVTFKGSGFYRTDSRSGSSSSSTPASTGSESSTSSDSSSKKADTSSSTGTTGSGSGTSGSSASSSGSSASTSGTSSASSS